MTPREKIVLAGAILVAIGLTIGAHVGPQEPLAAPVVYMSSAKRAYVEECIGRMYRATKSNFNVEATRGELEPVCISMYASDRAMPTR